MMHTYTKAEDIEKRSFEIIMEELEREHGAALRRFDKSLLPVLLRVIHTTADFSWVETLRASDGALAAVVQALREGAVIVTDTRMAEAGIDKKRLHQWGGTVLCFMADADVAEQAKQNGTTRAVASMDKAARLCRTSNAPFIFAIGNAPTALARLCELSAAEGDDASGGIAKGFKPRLVIGMPVGFVNVVESKDLLLSSALLSITAPGRKGGSAVAAAICNGLLRIAGGE
ncbi:MAG: precorrin-8X methylmutase [Treponema sp.]|jgi:precorrin-8X/cobalt-precorrin-8 methylmutase|nr:precorrin-8X methylmutase [Treponema sp.]